MVCLMEYLKEPKHLELSLFFSKLEANEVFGEHAIQLHLGLVESK